MDGIDDDTNADDEITDSLIKGLEAPTDDEDSGSDGDGREVGGSGSDGDGGEVGGASASSLAALQYATYMTGTLQFVKEKHRVQGYLAAELARARKELGGEADDDGPTKRPTLEVRVGQSCTSARHAERNVRGLYCNTVGRARLE